MTKMALQGNLWRETADERIFAPPLGETVAANLMGTSNNCHRSSDAPNLTANDSALFSFRFCAVHPKDVRNCPPRQLFEVP
jgi:hypothetical protein